MSIKATSVNENRLSNSGTTADNDSDQGLNNNRHHTKSSPQGLSNGATKTGELPLAFIPSSLLFVL